jgi:hypothetical protein
MHEEGMFHQEVVGVSLQGSIVPRRFCRKASDSMVNLNLIKRVVM